MMCYQVLMEFSKRSPIRSIFLLDGFGAVKEEGSTWDFLLGPRGRYERKALEQDWDTDRGRKKK